MRIVIDAQGAQTESRFRGIGRYTLEFIAAVAKNREHHEIIVVLSGLFPETIHPIRSALSKYVSQSNILVWYAPGPVREEMQGTEIARGGAEILREAFLESLNPDVIHICSLFEGYVDDAVTSIGVFDKKTPISIILYDLIPALNPKQYLDVNVQYAQFYNKKYNFLKQADCLLAISESAAREARDNIEDYSGIVENISTAIAPDFAEKNIELSEGGNLFPIETNYALYTGGCDQRKNLPRLVQAWGGVPKEVRRDCKLVFAGKISESTKTHLILIGKELGLNDADLLFLGYVTDSELVHLYKNCQLFVFPSWHEGFGLPALEAMACGAAVIAANTSSLPEVVGWSEALFDPMDVESITAKIQQALLDKEFNQKLRALGAVQLHKFSWEITAKRAIEAWERLAEPKKINTETRSSKGKKKLAYVSPIPPERTGIADYSAELLPALARQFDITIVNDKFSEEILIETIKLPVKGVPWLLENSDEMDYILYQMGNSPFHDYMLELIEKIPGVIVLHDFFLSGLISWKESIAGASSYWTQQLYQAHGFKAVQQKYKDPEQAKIDYPVSLDVIEKAKGIIVHSNFSHGLVQEWFGRKMSEKCTVIPHLRAPYVPFNKTASRRKLGLSEGDFVVCSFGFVDYTKLNHRLLDVWLNGSFANDKKCHLIFVGENHGGDYGQELMRRISGSVGKERIKITGFADAKIFKEYVAVADVAVQLRTRSRGETSGTVLDCMSQGVPVILNANGSMREFDPDTVYMLNDEFENSELHDAIRSLYLNAELRLRLGAAGQKLIHTQRAPQYCADLYARALEIFKHKYRYNQRNVIAALTEVLPVDSSDEALKRIANALALNERVDSSQKTFFVDVTATKYADHKSGIERVVKALVLSFMQLAQKEFKIVPVYLVNIEDRWRYKTASAFTLSLLNLKEDLLEEEIVQPSNGDIIVGLDNSGERLIKAAASGLFENIRNRGASIYFMIHDLLPIRLPDVFPEGAAVSHENWLRELLNFDGVIGVTKWVADDFRKWCGERGREVKKNPNFLVDYSHHGADIGSASPSQGVPTNASDVLDKMSKRKTFLMVGTIEPRKGYVEVIREFEKLWAADIDVNLIVVGQEGWRGLPDGLRKDIPLTVELLSNHKETGDRLFWLPGISDEFLDLIYQKSHCLIAASYGEGFGLPLIEAAQHGLPIVARDIGVFREVANANAAYFENEEGALSKVIKEWLHNSDRDQVVKSNGIYWDTWAVSAERLMNSILKHRKVIDMYPCDHKSCLQDRSMR